MPPLRGAFSEYEGQKVGVDMKFRDPKTGEVFEDIHQAKDMYCMGKECVGSCALMSNAMLCYQWVEDYPAEAARRMGLEVITDKEEPMEQKDKPRICEVLGVEINEEWRVTGNDVATYRINEDGEFEYAMPLYSRPGHGGWRDSDMAHLLDFIEHPDRIIRKPRFTEEEVVCMRVLYAAGIRTVERDKYTTLWMGDEGRAKSTALPHGMFPSLRPGQAVNLEEIIGEAPT